jgi:hypothetical protein
LCGHKGKITGHFFVLFLFLLLSLTFFYRFTIFKQNYIAADFTGWYYPWRFYIVQEENRNFYISNKNLGDPLFMFASVEKKYNEEIKKGRFLLWNDSSLMGHPAYASHTAAFFYPPKIIANYFFDFLDARDFLGIFHLFLMASAMYFYIYGLGLSKTSSFVGGLVWMLCGFVVCRVEFGTDIYPLAYLPLILLMTDCLIKKTNPLNFGLLSLLTGLCFLSGHWQFVFYVMLLWAAYSIFRLISLWKTDKKIPGIQSVLLLCSGITGFCISAVQSLPVIELTQIAARPSALDMSQAFASSRFLPENLLTLFLPELFGNPVHHFYLTRISSGVQNYFELMVYIGILPLILAAAGLIYGSFSAEKKFFGIVAVSSILMAMGTPLYAAIFYGLPFTKGFTPVRILCLLAFSLCILVSIGYQYISQKSEKKDKVLWISLSFTGLAFIISAFVIYQVQHETSLFAGMLEYYWKLGVMDLPHNYADKKLFVFEMISRIKTHYAWSNIQLTAPVIIGFISSILLYLYRRYGFNRTIFTLAAVLIILFDLFPLGQRFNPAFSREAIYPPSDGIRIMSADKDLYRVSGWKHYPHPNTLSVYGLNEVNGYYSMFPSSARDLFAAINGGSLPSPILAVFEEKAEINPGLAGLFNIRYFYNNPGGEPPQIPVKEIYNKDLAVFQNLNYLPRAFVVNKTETLPREEILARMLNQSFDPKKAALLESPFEDAQKSSKQPEGEAKASIMEYSPGKVTIQVSSPSNAYLVLSDTYYPGWKVYQDGKETQIKRAYFYARAVPISAGDHTVCFNFEPEALKIGGIISAFSLFLVFGIIIAGFILGCLNKPDSMAGAQSAELVKNYSGF